LFSIAHSITVMALLLTNSAAGKEYLTRIQIILCP